MTEYGDEIAKVLTHLKDKGVTALIHQLLQKVDLFEGISEFVLVPIPSSPTNYKKRGFSHTLLLAKKLARMNTRVRVVNLLTSSKNRTDQTQLGFTERKKNLAGACRLKKGFKPELPVILVDDIYTTGATSQEAARVLAEAGFTVLGCAVVALVF
ncbi:MAG: ComF family protein [Rhodoluna sp.]